MLDQLPPFIPVGFALTLGLLFGSFLNVVIHRVPREMSIAFPASHCPACGAPIRAFDNVPVFGWALLCGKARCCGAPISARYPIVEAIGGAAAVAIYFQKLAGRGLPLTTAFLLFALYLSLALGLIALTFIDLEFMILPDSLTLGGLGVGLLSATVRPEVSVLDAALASGSGFLLIWLPFIWGYEKLRGRPGMGLGDAKLLATSGAWFGWLGVFFVLFAAAIQGTLVALTLLLTRGGIEEPEAVRREREELAALVEQAEGEERRLLEEAIALDPIGDEPDGSWARARIPFGPFLALAMLEALLFHDELTLYFQELFLL